MTTSEHSTKRAWASPSGNNLSAGIEGSWDHTDWQRMWLRTQSLDWRTLALVPGDDHTSTFDVANLIVNLALDRGESLRVVDSRELSLKDVDAFVEGTRWDAGHNDRIIFATRSAATNLATVPLARAADCAILCVSLGSTSMDSARDTIEWIGRKHFLGSLLVRASTESQMPNGAPLPRLSAPKLRP